MTQTVQNDFDAIAKATTVDRWNHNNHYHAVILKHLPCQRATALDLGCGTGDLLLPLSAAFSSVTAVDFSHEMIARAQARLAKADNVQLIESDVQSMSYPPEAYDFIVSVATFHHLSMPDMLSKLRPALKIGGVLVILDLYHPCSLMDYMVAGLAFPVHAAVATFHNRGRTQSRAEQLAWHQHARNDHYATIPEVRGICQTILPGATVRRLFFWRYLLVWEKTDES